LKAEKKKPPTRKKRNATQVMLQEPQKWMGKASSADSKKPKLESGVETLRKHLRRSCKRVRPLERKA